MVTAVMVSAVVVPSGGAVLFAAAGQAPSFLSQVATVRRRERQSGIVNASAPETMLVATWVCAGHDQCRASRHSPLGTDGEFRICGASGRVGATTARPAGICPAAILRGVDLDQSLLWKGVFQAIRRSRNTERRRR